MLSKDIETILIKYLNKQASVDEMEILENWLENTENEKLFLEYVKVNYLIDVNLQNYDKSKFLIELLGLIKDEQRKSIKFNKKAVLRYAAIFLIFVSIASVYKLVYQTQEPSVTTMNEVVLKSENGLVNILKSNGTSQIKNREGKTLFDKIENALIYSNEQTVDALIYNTLIVPYGRRFSLTLSDGTIIQLNSGTSIKFPIKFLAGQERKVFIEYGEAFFEVAKDTKHPFIVNNNNIDIKVLGTQFNVSAYPEDQSTTTVLVEGSVQLYDRTNPLQPTHTIIKPGEQAFWKQSKNGFSVSNADIESQTGWREGKIVLKSLPFNQMIVKLQRHYNVDIECNDNQLNNEIITSTFKEESIEDVLELINEIHHIKYEVKGRNIKINKYESKK